MLVGKRFRPWFQDHLTQLHCVGLSLTCLSVTLCPCSSISNSFHLSRLRWKLSLFLYHSFASGILSESMSHLICLQLELYSGFRSIPTGLYYLFCIALIFPLWSSWECHTIRCDHYWDCLCNRQESIYPSNLSMITWRGTPNMSH